MTLLSGLDFHHMQMLRKTDSMARTESFDTHARIHEVAPKLVLLAKKEATTTLRSSNNFHYMHTLRNKEYMGKLAPLERKRMRENTWSLPGYLCLSSDNLHYVHMICKIDSMSFYFALTVPWLMGG